MNRLVVFFLAWFIPLLLLYADVRLLRLRWFELPGVPRGMRKPLQIASSWCIIKHIAFKIACPSLGHLHLVLLARLPGPRDYVQLVRADLVVFVDDNLNKLIISRKLVAVGQVDPIVTLVLTSQRLQRIIPFSELPSTKSRSELVQSLWYSCLATLTNRIYAASQAGADAV